jgi:hypothetical protein
MADVYAKANKKGITVQGKDIWVPACASVKDEPDTNCANKAQNHVKLTLDVGGEYRHLAAKAVAGKLNVTIDADVDAAWTVKDTHRCAVTPATETKTISETTVFARWTGEGDFHYTEARDIKADGAVDSLIAEFKAAFGLTVTCKYDDEGVHFALIDKRKVSCSKPAGATSETSVVTKEGALPDDPCPKE